MSLASSALHLKGLSQQETFLLNEKEKMQESFIVFFPAHVSSDGFHLQQVTMRVLHHRSASALAPSSGHGRS